METTENKLKSETLSEQESSELNNRNEIPKGMIPKKELSKMIKTIPVRIRQMEEKKRLEKFIEIRAAVRECFVAHPELLNLTGEESYAIMTEMGIPATKTMVFDVRSSLKQIEASPTE